MRLHDQGHVPGRLISQLELFLSGCKRHLHAHLSSHDYYLRSSIGRLYSLSTSVRTIGEPHQRVDLATSATHLARLHSPTRQSRIHQ
jgi:hypothetical protein